MGLRSGESTGQLSLANSFDTMSELPLKCELNNFLLLGHHSADALTLTISPLFLRIWLKEYPEVKVLPWVAYV